MVNSLPGRSDADCVKARRNYPNMRDDDVFEYKGRRHAVLVTWAEGEEAHRFCGDNWCTGECGLPALMLLQRVDGAPSDFKPVPRKASGSQVACGQAFQSLRVEWVGEVVEVPEEYRGVAAEMMWW